MKLVTIITICLLVSMPAFAETADDCIAMYEDLKAQFQDASPGAQVNCVREGNMISLDAEGPLPSQGCEGGEWDHWHLEAKAIIGNNSACILMLRGLKNRKGCGTEEIRMELPANEAAAWRRYLEDECPR